MTPHHSEHCISALPHLRLALAIVNGKWKLPILVAIRTGHRRFGDIVRGVAGISAKVLAKELKDLETHQLVKRTVLAGPPVAVSYEVLPYADTLDPIIFALREWGMQHEQRLAIGGTMPTAGLVQE